MGAQSSLNGVKGGNLPGSQFLVEYKQFKEVLSENILLKAQKLRQFTFVREKVYHPAYRQKQEQCQWRKCNAERHHAVCVVQSGQTEITSTGHQVSDIQMVFRTKQEDTAEKEGGTKWIFIRQCCFLLKPTSLTDHLSIFNQN